MDDEVAACVAGCTAAHRRLEATVAAVDDATARRPSLLPGWTVGHVLTHLAGNADSHVRMLEGAVAGKAVEQYPGGHEQRNADIEAGAGRSGADLGDDVRATAAALEAVWGRMTPEAWAGHGLSRGDPWPCRILPFHRWREVEIHHADLGLGYSPRDWPEDYVARELPLALADLPDRLTVDGRADVLAWLVGRAGQPAAVDVAPWQAKWRYHHRPPEGS